MEDPSQLGASKVPAKFNAGDKVLVPHTDKFYEAKILKVEFRGQSQGWHYFLHYSGWNKKYDEWVEESGLVNPNSQDAIAANASALNRKRQVPMGPGGLLVPGGALGGAARGPARGAGGALLPPLGGATHVVGLDVDLPPILKKYLIDDFECVFEESRFVPLPRKPTVAELLHDYVARAREVRQTQYVDAEEEVANGLIGYFDKCLLALLLYRNERGQAAQVLSDGRCPSTVYGAEHLLRLLYKLPEILPLQALTQEHQAHVATMVQDVVQYLTDNHASLFLTRDQFQAPNPGGIGVPLPPGAGAVAGAPLLSAPS